MANDEIIGSFNNQLALSPAAFGAKGEAAQAVTVDTGLPVASAAPAAPVTATIANGASLSGAIDLAAQRLHRIVTPAAWTAAAITFQASPDGVTYYDLWYSDAEVTIASATVPTAAQRSVVVDPAVFLGIRYLKLRSGTAAAGVNQGASRAITLVTVAR